MAKASAATVGLPKREPHLSIARPKALRASNNPAYLQQTNAHAYAGLRKGGIAENWVRRSHGSPLDFATQAVGRRGVPP